MTTVEYIPSSKTSAFPDQALHQKYRAFLQSANMLQILHLGRIRPHFYHEIASFFV